MVHSPFFFCLVGFDTPLVLRDELELLADMLFYAVVPVQYSIGDSITMQ